MKIGIYNSSFESSVAGNLSAALLAVALAHKNQVELVITDSSMRDQFHLLSDGAAQRVFFRTIGPAPQITSDPGSPARRYEALRHWSQTLTAGYDLFVNFSDRLPIYSSAPRSILMVQFPYDFIPSTYRALWISHLQSYQLKLANSYYTQLWTRVFWEIDCPVVYPPVPRVLSSTPKENLIVSAGSFNASRPHEWSELISAFKQLRLRLPDWSLMLFGDLDNTAGSRKQFESVRDAAGRAGISVAANPSFKDRSEHFSRARIFWQAAGSRHDLDLEPRKAEAFDLDLVRAMAAGCVPLVINTGAVSEIVRHGENGFFWKDSDELLDFTLQLARNEQKYQQLTRAVQLRAHEFSPEKYVDNFRLQLEIAFGIRDYSRANPVWLWKRLVNSATQQRIRL